jgi:GT2 family glycosyltransferase
MAEAVYQLSDKSFPRVPFINGFCFAIKREVIDKIGYLDEIAFPRGYGEENDYCLRTLKAGMQLAVADQCYIFHAKSKSYNHQRRAELSKLGGQALQAKHGRWLIQRYLYQLKHNAPLNQCRQRIQHWLEHP